jgi:hypothetical protein
MTVPLTLPVEAWGRLVSRAEDRGMTVAELIATTLRPLTEPKPKRGHAGAQESEHRVAVIVRRRGEGWTWPQIAAELGVSHGAVYELARRNGLTKPRGNK